MEEGEFVLTAAIDLEFPKWDLSVLGGLKNTHRILLKILHCNYSTDQDLQLVLFYKRGLDDTEEAIPYTLPANQTFFKQKLPIGILVREWRLQVISVEDLTTMKLIELGTAWIAHPVGIR